MISHKSEVEKGGVYFRCKDCGVNGVIKAGVPFAEDVRKHHNLPAPAPCGVEFTKDTGCPRCGQKESVV